MSIKVKSIDNQVMVITGASSGIGMATAELAASRGAKVVLSGRSEHALNEITDRLKTKGYSAICVVADVADRQQVQRIADMALSQFGRIDTWVNNAGISIYGRLAEVSEEDSRRLFDTNFWGVVNGSLVALPHLRQNGGALINLGSEVSDAVVPLQGMYSASKHAVKGFIDALRVEIEEIDKAPVSITLIQPTAVDTPFPQHAKNYLEHEPKLPSPMIDPNQVAEAILESATSHTRAIKVGTMSKVNTFIAKNAPALGDKLSATMEEKQQHKSPPLRNRDGALFAPSEDPHIHGYAKGIA